MSRGWLLPQPLSAWSSIRLVPSQAPIQRKSRGQIHSITVVVVVALFVLMIVPTVAEDDFVRGQKAVVKSSEIGRDRDDHADRQDGNLNKLAEDNQAVLHAGLHNVQNFNDKGHKNADGGLNIAESERRQGAAVLNAGKVTPVAQLLQNNQILQRLAELQHKDEQIQGERQQHHEQQQQKHPNDNDKDVHDNVVHDIQDKKIEAPALTNQNQGVDLSKTDNNRNINIQQNYMANKLENSTINKQVGGGAVNNQVENSFKEMPVGHGLLQGNKDDNRRDDIHVHAQKPESDIHVHGEKPESDIHVHGEKPESDIHVHGEKPESEDNKHEIINKETINGENGEAPVVISGGTNSQSQMGGSNIGKINNNNNAVVDVHASPSVTSNNNNIRQNNNGGQNGNSNGGERIDNSNNNGVGQIDKSNNNGVGRIDNSNNNGVGQIDKSNNNGVGRIDNSNNNGVDRIDNSNNNGGQNSNNNGGQNDNSNNNGGRIDNSNNVGGQNNNNGGQNDNNGGQNGQQQFQHNPEPQQQKQPEIGGINISWDWEDFSIMLNSYGAAEMKVRRTPHATTGEPWPLPQYYSKKDDKIFRLSKDLTFIPTGVKCDILEEALARHLQRTLRGSVEDMYDNLQNAEGSPIEDPTLRYGKDEFMKAPVISRVEVKVRNPCSKYPMLESDESYDVVVKKKKTYIWANEVWGALRGLETFGHLVWKGTDEFLYIKETVISDYPRFAHRGLLVDTSRHFLFKEVILDIIECMEMNKLNVFHWHIVDDQSFPYESKVYPELSRKGAFHPTYVYSLEDIAEIIEYARLRGIRVMPEFDTPGHTYAWGFSRPELLTQCYTSNIPVKGYFGPIDPSKNSTYRFLQTLFQEIVDVFKDQYIHLGGDEVPLGCWQSNPEVMAFARELAKLPRAPQAHNQMIGNNGGWSMWSDEIRKVYEYYENRLISIVSEAGQKRKKNVKYVMWQEVMNNNLQLPNDTIIQVWMGDMGDVMRATSMGYQVLYSTCWYMDHIEYGTKWTKYYNCDPVDQTFGYHIDEKKVLGGEAAFWSEYFTNENLLPLMWPRASAAAERLWSSKDVKNLDKAAARLSEHRCRMIKRGINVGEINGPGYCLHAPPKRRLFNETLGCRGGNCTHTRSLIKENFEVFVSQRGSGLAECGRVLATGNSSMFIMLILTLIVVFALYTLSKSSNRLQRVRICKNRTILVVFVLVLLVYFLCYTTIWMRAFEFSGSYHKTLQEDNTSETEGNHVDNSENIKKSSS